MSFLPKKYYADKLPHVIIGSSGISANPCNNVSELFANVYGHRLTG